MRSGGGGGGGRASPLMGRRGVWKGGSGDRPVPRGETKDSNDASIAINSEGEDL